MRVLPVERIGDDFSTEEDDKANRCQFISTEAERSNYFFLYLMLSLIYRDICKTQGSLLESP